MAGTAVVMAHELVTPGQTTAWKLMKTHVWQQKRDR